jgi:hypothetical protein
MDLQTRIIFARFSISDKEPHGVRLIIKLPPKIENLSRLLLLLRRAESVTQRPTLASKREVCLILEKQRAERSGAKLGTF